jgi:hypothetical protein
MHRRQLLRALALVASALALALLALATGLRFHSVPATPPAVRTVRMQV